jgi:hypothetical protein
LPGNRALRIERRSHGAGAVRFGLTYGACLFAVEV